MKEKTIQCWLILIVLIALSSLLFYHCAKNAQEKGILTNIKAIQQSLEKQKAEDCIIVRTSKGWVCKSINSNDIYMIGE